MKILGMGIDYRTGGLLIPAIDEAAFAERIEMGMGLNNAELRARTAAAVTRSTFRREIELTPVIDLRDPRAAGWTFLVNGDDPNVKDIVDLLRPLAEHRGMNDPGKPLIFHANDDWEQWLIDNYTSVDVEGCGSFEVS